MNLFKPPAAARAAKTLDRALFSRTLPTVAASVRENKLISKYRMELGKTREVLLVEKFDPIAADPDEALAAQGKKCLILRPDLKISAPEAWSPVLQEATKIGDLKIVPFDVTIDYKLWSYVDVMRSIIPEELQDEIPASFNTAGHVAHLNMRERYQPYKHVIGQVILDKNPVIRTVINKTDDVGTQNEFRTFSYEVLAGPDDMLVEVSEAGCVFNFDYSKVYWNSKLSGEHERICATFKPGEVVADVMAGIGPFAAPAGKKGVFVWANDKNPESYKYLTDIVKRNKVTEFVKPFNEDGHDFIKRAADLVLEASQRGDCAVLKPVKVSRSVPPGERPEPVRVPVPPTISHYVMNLPASALEFLHNFKGLYHGREMLFTPHTDTKLPLIHAHCFAVKADDATPLDDICQRIYSEIGVQLKPGSAEVEGEVAIHEVRDVAPAKRMFCASFRLPPEVAFSPRA
ncbi:Met-10+ like-protein [Metarhizium robertsii]|uniref:tRNA (guanine(37)-N1)-methyltransferase n=2 Tax=Metarhizium robertsii TaxID=568076 RepID=E9F4Q7_METRA|nr:tRNA (guanine(37)-N1)-methyltransferase [Metarhizium robertsii ARSEF 23]EFY97239.1 tRNA (guanine(37)-N1)-methyltransferase [Metarhizium robertsii ARSEF 23]EXV00708.1 Met-10+ like-protein [Metarhizium robertsii]